MMKRDDITALTTAAFLNSFSKQLNQWSMLFALASVLILGLKHYNHFLAASLIFALYQAYLAARCAFDAAVFSSLTGEDQNYQLFDQFLNDYKLAKTNNPRPLNQRVQGALNLLKKQAIGFALQILLLAIGLATLP